METNGALKPVAIAFESIVLPEPGAPRKSSPRSRLPPAASKASPDCQSETTRRTSSFTSAWPRTSSSLHAPVGVARLERMDLREGHHQERAEQDQEVLKRSAAGRQGTSRRSSGCRASRRRPEKKLGRGVRPARVVEAADHRDREPGDGDRADEHEAPLDPAPPEPRAAPRQDVLLAQLISSVPKRLGHGITRSKTSIDPRKAATPTIVPTSAQRQSQPRPWWRKKKAAGLVSSGDEGGGPRERPPLARELRRALGWPQVDGRSSGRHFPELATRVNPELC